MRPEEVRALGDLAGEFAEGIATQARDVHGGIADRVFGLLGEPAAPVRAAHDAISTRWGMVGDLLVRRSSAWSHEGRGEQLQFALDHYNHLGGATHFDLLNHPTVYAQLRRWLTAGRELAARV
jgi:hypothetical protein